MKAWGELFAENGVAIETTVRRRPPERPVEADLDAVERELGIRLPASYRTFCLEVGPADCDDHGITIYTPLLGNPGLLLTQVAQARDFLGTLRQDAKPFAPEFRPQSVIAFARNQDATHFFWQVDEPTTGDEYAIYSLGEEFDGTGSVAWIKRLAGTFPEFVFDTAFGEGLVTHGVYGKWNEAEQPKRVLGPFCGELR